MVVDIGELTKLDASEVHGRRHNVKDVLTSTSGEHFIFPFADGTAHLCGRDH